MELRAYLEVAKCRYFQNRLVEYFCFISIWKGKEEVLRQKVAILLKWPNKKGK